MQWQANLPARHDLGGIIVRSGTPDEGPERIVSTGDERESAARSDGRSDAPLPIVLGRKWLILVTVLLAMGATYAVSSSLDKVYTTESTLLVALPSDESTFDTVQAGQAIARSYADLIESPNIAESVAEEIGGNADAGDVAAATTFESLPETQLLKIKAEATDPQRAKEIADAYADVFTDHARTDLNETTDAEIELADEAPLPGSAARPKPVLYTLIAGVLGLVLAVTLALLAHRLDRRLRGWEEVERRFGLPLLARVPVRRRSKASVTAFEEAFRILRTNLQFAGGGGAMRSIAVVSERPGEGKTTAVAKLAEAIAESGRKVVAVEGDFRRPALEQALAPDRKQPMRPGLSNYLVEAATIEDVVHPTGRPNLDVVPSGPLPPSPSALLDSARAQELLAALEERSEVVLIDCPPLSVGADASVTTKWVDAVILVIDMDAATDRSVRNALRQLEAVQASVAGVVLNRDHAIEDSAYGYYGDTPGRVEAASYPATQPSEVAGSNGAGADELVADGRRFGRRRRQRTGA